VIRTIHLLREIHNPAGSILLSCHAAFFFVVILSESASEESLSSKSIDTAILFLSPQLLRGLIKFQLQIRISGRFIDIPGPPFVPQPQDSALPAPGRNLDYQTLLSSPPVKSYCHLSTPAGFLGREWKGKMQISALYLGTPQSQLFHLLSYLLPQSRPLPGRNARLPSSSWIALHRRVKPGRGLGSPMGLCSLGAEGEDPAEKKASPAKKKVV
jgi:hypothetical protein